MTSSNQLNWPNLAKKSKRIGLVPHGNSLAPDYLWPLNSRMGTLTPSQKLTACANFWEDWDVSGPLGLYPHLRGKWLCPTRCTGHVTFHNSRPPGFFSPGRLGPAKDLSSRKTQTLTVTQGGWTLLPSYTNRSYAKDNYYALCFQSHICSVTVACIADAKIKSVRKLITDSRVASLPENSKTYQTSRHENLTSVPSSLWVDG